MSTRVHRLERTQRIPRPRGEVFAFFAVMADLVEYALPFGFVGRAARWLLVGRALDRIFDHRRDVIARLFEGR